MLAELDGGPSKLVRKTWFFRSVELTGATATHLDKPVQAPLENVPKGLDVDRVARNRRDTDYLDVVTTECHSQHHRVVTTWIDIE